MFDLDIDLVVHFVPQMNTEGRGIRLRRSMQIPFPPSAEVSVFSKSWDEIDEPLGFRLKDITWDLDRSRFLAITEQSICGTPIVMIPHEIRWIMRRGWKYGSFVDDYKVETTRGRKRRAISKIKIGKWDEDEAEAWEQSKSSGRPPEFKIVWKSIIATLAQLQNNSATAFAMNKTGIFFDAPAEPDLKTCSEAQRRYLAAQDEYLAMTSDQQWQWRDAILRRYPRLPDVVDAIR